jgi:hypothetical protein
MDKVQKPSNSECYTPSSEHFRLYMSFVFVALITFEPLASFMKLSMIIVIALHPIFVSCVDFDMVIM